MFPKDILLIIFRELAKRSPLTASHVNRLTFYDSLIGREKQKIIIPYFLSRLQFSRKKVFTVVIKWENGYGEPLTLREVVSIATSNFDRGHILTNRNDVRVVVYALDNYMGLHLCKGVPSKITEYEITHLNVTSNQGIWTSLNIIGVEFTLELTVKIGLYNYKEAPCWMCLLKSARF